MAMEEEAKLRDMLIKLESLLADIERVLKATEPISEDDLAKLRELRQQCENEMALLARLKEIPGAQTDK